MAARRPRRPAARHAAGGDAPLAADPPPAAVPSWGASQTPVQSRAEWRAARRAARRARRHQAPDTGEAGLIFGAVLIVIGALFLAREAIPWFDFHVWWPIGLIGLGALLLAAAVRPH